MRVALVVGSTGLIGQQLIELLISDVQYDKVKCLTRKPLPLAHDKLEVIETDGSNLNELADRLTANDIFCCLGTTMKKAKSKEAFRRVDFDYPLGLAQVTKKAGATQFHLVSALGADAKSSIFYNKVKGEVEQAISNVTFQTFHIYRPSLLLGPRQEERSGEQAAVIFFKIFGFLVPAKYKPIDSVKIARAMIDFAKKEQQGKFIHESKSLQDF